MRRSIVGFHQDEAGDFVAELACGHGQHVRHRPPFEDRTWVLEESSRRERLGTPLDCPLCDRREPPADIRFVRATPRWERASMPAGLRVRHRVAERTWARLVVERGSLELTLAAEVGSEPEVLVRIDAGGSTWLPPVLDHEVRPDDAALFYLEFYAIGPAI